MIKAQGKVSDVKEVIEQLKDLNMRIERLLGQTPTSDDKILAELDTLFNRLQRILMLQTTKEKGSVFLEQATGKAMCLKERYHSLSSKGKLRKNLS